MRATTMQEFFTRAGTLATWSHERAHRAWSTTEVWVTTWVYAEGRATFDGRDWSFELAEGVRA